MSTEKQTSPEARMASYLKRIATGPEMSKDLSLEEARDGMTLILEGLVSNVQAAVFLIALRMKRESDDENRGVLEALRQATQTVTAPIPDLTDLADPYDGFKRHLPAAPFLPAVLAACGLPTISHGCHRLGPKFGVTHHQILAAAGARVNLTPEQAAHRLADPEVGWAYIDQKEFCPPLHNLVELRRLIVKRPCLSTLEKLCGPIRAQQRTHLLVGYVHRDYERLLPLLARHAGYTSALVVRGVEGGIVPALNTTAACVAYTDGGEERQLKLDPKEAGLESTLRAVPLPSDGLMDSDDEEGPTNDTDTLAAASIKAGLAALSGTTGTTRDSLVYTGATLLYALGRFDSLRMAATAIRDALDSGAALKRFQKGS